MNKIVNLVTIQNLIFRFMGKFHFYKFFFGIIIYVYLHEKDIFTNTLFIKESKENTFTLWVYKYK